MLVGLLIFIIVLLIGLGAGFAMTYMHGRIKRLEETVAMLSSYNANRIPYKASQQVEDALALTNRAFWMNERAILQIRQDYEHITGLQEVAGKLQQTLMGLRDTSRNQSPPPLD